VARIAGHVPRRGAVGIAPVVITYERPSRASRVLVILSALVAIVLSAWMVTPILMANYPTAFAAIPLLRDVLADGATSDSQVRVPPPTGHGSREARDLVIERQAEPPQPATAVTTPEPAPAPIEEQTAGLPAIVVAAPADPPTPDNEAVAATLPAGLMPWPVAAPQTVAASEVEPALEPQTPPEDFGRVPLPPRRPDAAAMARLGTPLPRPRPATAPAAEVEATVPDGERLLFDRLTAPN
jgi:hypothetical protein